MVKGINDFDKEFDELILKYRAELEKHMEGFFGDWTVQDYINLVFMSEDGKKEKKNNDNRKNGGE